MAQLINRFKLNLQMSLIFHHHQTRNHGKIAGKTSGAELKEYYELLNIPQDSNHNTVRNAFIELAKRYHPDSHSPEANIEKFVQIENAFRVLSKHNTGSNKSDELDGIVFDIKHTAPQHRQYLSYEGVGHGTPYQRMKQWAHKKAERAAENVLHHRLNKTEPSDKVLMKKGQYKKHDIKTKYGFDRLVEDLIQESISKGEFENLTGSGKPLREQTVNPYVDFTTHKLNEVLINNGFTPEWIMMNKDIDNEIKLLKEDLLAERSKFGPCPLNDNEVVKWKEICSANKDLVKSINMKINTFNLIVPLMNKQRLHVCFDDIANEVLLNGKSGTNVDKEVALDKKVNNAEQKPTGDLMDVLFSAFYEIFNRKNIR